MINLHERMLPTQLGWNPQPPDLLSLAHLTEPSRLAFQGSLLQFLFFHMSVIANLLFCLSLFVAHLFFFHCFQCFEKAALHDCDLSWVTSVIVFATFMPYIPKQGFFRNAKQFKNTKTYLPCTYRNCLTKANLKSTYKITFGAKIKHIILTRWSC